MTWIQSYEEAVSYLCPQIQHVLMSVSSAKKKTAAEIRLCIGREPALLCKGEIIYVKGITVTYEILQECVLSLTRCSVQAHEDELAQGFLSVPGGHRAGLAGTAVFSRGQAILGMREYNAVVLRIAHEGCEEGKITAGLLLKNGLCGILLAGVPGSGKTTLLRQLGEVLTEKGVRAVLADERGEFVRAEGLCRLTGYPKARAILMALRSLSPQAILCDELGGEEDTQSVLWALNCGVPVIGTAHADSLEQLFQRKGTALLLASGAFKKIAILDALHPGTVREVYENDGGTETWRRTAFDPVLVRMRNAVGRQVLQEDFLLGTSNSISCDGSAEAALYEDADRAAAAVCL